jgi:hypothetical protein
MTVISNSHPIPNENVLTYITDYFANHNLPGMKLVCTMQKYPYSFNV